MAGTGHRIACKAAILFFSVGAVIAESRAQVSSQSVPDEAAQKTQAPIGEANLTAPKPAADGEFQSAPKLFSKGKFAEAERQFAWIAQVRKGTTWGERSQYCLAECQFQQKKYVEALESIRRLYIDYPATNYRDQLVRREREIAQYWLVQSTDCKFLSAPKLFRKGKFAEAESQFAWIAQARKGTTWGERGQYYLAECQYQQKKYVEAFESLQRLHVDYPATDYRDQLARREYEIAQFWLAEARGEDPAGKNPPVAVQVNGRPPLADTEKKALRAFEAARHHDPMGPLAGDAAVQIAEYYMRSRDFESAATYYAQFVADFPKNPLRPRARLRGIQARTCSFLATPRDTASLKMAREFAKPFLRSYFDFGDHDRQ
jgi:outer membrane protein assembly factor BamD (BamD/ComL family)